MTHEEMIKITSKLYNLINGNTQVKEDINVELLTATSKRLEHLCKEYNKLREDIVECSEELIKLLEENND